jgi:hypothetical protein
VQQTVKDMNQTLVDDFLVFSDKIGSANFFWSFPSKAYQDQLVRKETLNAAGDSTALNVQSLMEQIAQARGARQGAGRARRLGALEGMKAESRACDVQLEGLKVRTICVCAHTQASTHTQPQPHAHPNSNPHPHPQTSVTMPHPPHLLPPPPSPLVPPSLR